MTREQVFEFMTAQVKMEHTEKGLGNSANQVGWGTDEFKPDSWPITDPPFPFSNMKAGPTNRKGIDYTGPNGPGEGFVWFCREVIRAGLLSKGIDPDSHVLGWDVLTDKEQRRINKRFAADGLPVSVRHTEEDNVPPVHDGDDEPIPQVPAHSPIPSGHGINEDSQAAGHHVSAEADVTADVHLPAGSQQRAPAGSPIHVGGHGGRAADHATAEPEVTAGVHTPGPSQLRAGSTLPPGQVPNRKKRPPLATPPPKNSMFNETSTPQDISRNTSPQVTPVQSLFPPPKTVNDWTDCPVKPLFPSPNSTMSSTNSLPRYAPIIGVLSTQCEEESLKKRKNKPPSYLKDYVKDDGENFYDSFSNMSSPAPSLPGNLPDWGTTGVERTSPSHYLAEKPAVIKRMLSEESRKNKISDSKRQKHNSPQIEELRYQFPTQDHVNTSPDNHCLDCMDGFCRKMHPAKKFPSTSHLLNIPQSGLRNFYTHTVGSTSLNKESLGMLFGEETKQGHFTVSHILIVKQHQTPDLCKPTVEGNEQIATFLEIHPQKKLLALLHTHPKTGFSVNPSSVDLHTMLEYQRIDENMQSIIWNPYDQKFQGWILTDKGLQNLKQCEKTMHKYITESNPEGFHQHKSDHKDWFEQSNMKWPLKGLCEVLDWR